MTTEELRKFQAQVLEEIGDYKQVFQDWYHNADDHEIEATCFLGWAIKHLLEE